MSGVEIWFYHLERSSVEDTLPPLLEKCVERQWRVIVKSNASDQLDALDKKLWTYKPNAWLPHALVSDDAASNDRQPILLACDDSPLGEQNLQAQALFLLEGAGWAGVTELKRIFVLFDGRDENAVALARNNWRAAKTAGFIPSYWRQSEDGKWSRTS